MDIDLSDIIKDIENKKRKPITWDDIERNAIREEEKKCGCCHNVFGDRLPYDPFRHKPSYYQGWPAKID